MNEVRKIRKHDANDFECIPKSKLFLYRDSRQLGSTQKFYRYA
jgi:hypothetical protein